MKSLVSLFALTLLGFGTFAQSSVEVYNRIRTQDSLLFSVGFNNCDLKQFQEILSDEFVFYHDRAGEVNSKAAFIADVRNNVCSLPYKPTRKLKSNEIYPLQKNGVVYGAVQTGVHQFYATAQNKPEYLTSTAKFTHVWLLERGAFKLSKAYSYDHQDAEPPIDEALLFNDKKETERWLRQKHIPALGIGFIDHGKVAQISVFGELEPGKPAPKNTVWNVASLTKPITALVALKLADAGKIDLDEPLYRYYTDPDVAADTNLKRLTARFVLSHRTGFPNWRYKNADGKLRFEFAPGTKYQYSGEGFEYLRKALESKFHKSLPRLAKSLIFEPLDMSNTSFVWNDDINTKLFARWHNARGELYPLEKNRKVNAADNLLTTVEDYTKFILHVLHGAGLSTALYRQMVSEQARINDVKHFGLGWWIDERINAQGDYAIVHGGDDIGVHTIVFLVPKADQALLIFTNSDNGTDAFKDVLLQFLGKDGEGILNDEMK